MNWNRHKSKLEALVVDVLSESSNPLTISEIAEIIAEREPGVFNGPTPERSLYSIIYRREKRRKHLGIEPLIIRNDSHPVKYTLNKKNIQTAGIKISQNV